MFNMHEIGAELRRLREWQNETERETGSAVGVSQAYINMMEKGQRVPVIEVLERLVTHLGAELQIKIVRKGASARTPEEIEDEQFVASVAALAPRVRDPVERRVFLRDLERAAERETERRKIG